jgi:hypothetical protein
MQRTELKDHHEAPRKSEQHSYQHRKGNSTRNMRCMGVVLLQSERHTFDTKQKQASTMKGPQHSFDFPLFTSGLLDEHESGADHRFMLQTIASQPPCPTCPELPAHSLVLQVLASFQVHIWL